jgi:hypothetical protein
MYKDEKKELMLLRKRIDMFCSTKVNAFSPTLSPAPKSFERNEIESPYEAIKYYLDKGIVEFIIQKKYMGSYCDIYLHHEINKSYLVSRNGYIIRNISEDNMISALKPLYDKIDWSNLEFIIIQSELLPWSALGGGLISNEFFAYHFSHANHHSQLVHSDLYIKIEKVKASAVYTEYMHDKTALNKKELDKKYASHIKRQYDSIADFKILDLPNYKKNIDIFEHQVNLYGKSGEIKFKPFNILKKIFKNSEEELVNNNLTYAEINDDEYLHLTINNEDELTQKINIIDNWYKLQTAHGEEGIVIKPTKAFIKGCPPAFKVRNDQYLQMVYGINFLDDYKRHMSKRNVSQKITCSVNDWMINWELLKTPYNNIDKDNYYYKNLVYDRIMGEKVTATLDTRL